MIPNFLIDFHPSLSFHHFASDGSQSSGIILIFALWVIVIFLLQTHPTVILFIHWTIILFIHWTVILFIHFIIIFFISWQRHNSWIFCRWWIHLFHLNYFHIVCTQQSLLEITLITLSSIHFTWSFFRVGLLLPERIYFLRVLWKSILIIFLFLWLCFVWLSLNLFSFNILLYLYSSITFIELILLGVLYIVLYFKNLLLLLLTLELELEEWQLFLFIHRECYLKIIWGEIVCLVVCFC